MSQLSYIITDFWEMQVLFGVFLERDVWEKGTLGRGHERAAKADGPDCGFGMKKSESFRILLSAKQKCPNSLRSDNVHFCFNAQSGN